MLNSFYLFITPLTIVCVYIFVKYVANYGHIQSKYKLSDVEKEEEQAEFLDKIDAAKSYLFLVVDNFKSSVIGLFKILTHWFLHLLVILLKYISDFTDFLYEKSRDFFLSTAAKEKRVVSTFWHHLKKYKKEKDEENED